MDSSSSSLRFLTVSLTSKLRNDTVDPKNTAANSQINTFLMPK